jgi:hypothetical protein
MREQTYRLVVGEVGNEQGHIIECYARSLDGARRAAHRALQPYGGDGWCTICDVVGDPGNRQYPRIETIGRRTL